MNNDQQDMKAAAMRYFEGQATTHEHADLQQFIEQDPRNLQLFRQWEEEWTGVGASRTRSTDEAWQRLCHTIATDEADETGDMPIGRHLTAGLRIWHKIAAAAMLLLITTLTALLVTGGKDSVRTFRCAAPAGSRTQVTLPDGSVVWLNSGSELTYTNRFANSNRQVALRGEAFFEVKKHGGKPFTVHTTGYDVTVSGTRFNVSAYDGDSLSTTTLMDGKVELSDGQRQLTLAPGQAATLDHATGRLSLVRADTQADAWRTGRLMCSDISMRDFAHVLERQYDVRVSIATPQCADMRISVMLQNNETIDEVLDALEQITSHKASRNGRNVTIR